MNSSGYDKLKATSWRSWTHCMCKHEIAVDIYSKLSVKRTGRLIECLEYKPFFECKFLPIFFEYMMLFLMKNEIMIRKKFAEHGEAKGHLSSILGPNISNLFNFSFHGLRTPNEGINQRYLK